MAFSQQAVDYLSAHPKRFNILHGSVRSGKTTNSLLLAPERFAKAPKGDIVISGKTERTAYRNIVRALQQMYGERRVKYTKGMAEGRLGNRTFYVVGANDETAEGKVQGLTVAYWLADEAVLNPQTFIKQMQARMSPTGACADLTMNPAGPHHHIKTDIIDKADELDAQLWHFLLEHNPNLSPAYVENLKKEYGYGSLFYKRYILGLWVLAEGAVYPFFDEEKHVIPGPPCKADYYTVAVDYGTGNATAFGLFGHMLEPLKVFPYVGLRCWLERLYYWDSRKPGNYQKTDADYARDFGAFVEGTPLRSIIVDPSAASFKLELRRSGWSQVIDADNSVVDGIRTQATMLQSGAYKICEAAEQAIVDYSAYLWDAKAQARGEDKPLKQDDHVMDMTRYNLQTIYGIDLLPAGAW